jgi:hypothetical protein
MNQVAEAPCRAVRRLLAEFLIVALGVMAALAADNRNDSRKERGIERSFLDGIALDMEQNVANIDRAIDQAERNKTALRSVIRGLETGVSQWPSPDDFVRDLAFKRRLAEYYAKFEYHSQFHGECRRKEAAVEEALLGFLPLRERLLISDDLQAPLASNLNVDE